MRSGDFPVLSYLSDKLLTERNTVATLDELYIWLSNVTTIEYIRNTLCGNERYLLEVHAPPHKAELFGKAGRNIFLAVPPY